MNPKRQVNKRENDNGRRTPRQGEYDAVAPSKCEFCQGEYLPYKRGQKYCSPDCGDKANRRKPKRLAYMLKYRRDWREKVKRDRPEDHEAYLAHARKQLREARFNSGVTKSQRPERWLENKAGKS